MLNVVQGSFKLVGVHKTGMLRFSVQVGFMQQVLTLMLSELKDLLAMLEMLTYYS